MPEKGAEGVIIAQGAQHRRLEPLRQGRQAQVLLQLGRLQALHRRGDHEDSGRRAPGAHGVRLRRRRPGQGRQSHPVHRRQEGRRGSIDATLAIVFSADDGCDVGEDTGAPVSPDYGPQGNAFNGQVKGVQLAIADAAEKRTTWSDPEEPPSASPWRGSNSAKPPVWGLAAPRTRTLEAA